MWAPSAIAVVALLCASGVAAQGQHDAAPFFVRTMVGHPGVAAFAVGYRASNVIGVGGRWEGIGVQRSFFTGVGIEARQRGEHGAAGLNVYGGLARCSNVGGRALCVGFEPEAWNPAWMITASASARTARDWHLGTEAGIRRPARDRSGTDDLKEWVLFAFIEYRPVVDQRR